MLRLIKSEISLSRFSSMAALRNQRFFCTDPTKSDGAFKTEEADTVHVPPLSEKVLVLGGNGFVGSHICREALNRGLTVASLSRSGRSTIQESWANDVIWHRGNLLSDDSWKDALKGVTSVIPDDVILYLFDPFGSLLMGLQRIEAYARYYAEGLFKDLSRKGDIKEISCVGGFGSNSQMYKINGTANINAIRAAAEEGVKRFVYISAADFGVANYLLQGYYEGKRAAETELLTRYTYGGVILRPGFIYGTRRIGSMKLPLGVIGSPMEMVLQRAKPLSQLPLVGPLFTPPVNVTSVAKVAVRAASDPVFPPGIVDVFGILRYSQQKSI